MEGSERIIALLREMGVTCYAGVTGGSVLNLTTRLEPFRVPGGGPHLLTLSEFVAGFLPIGYHLAGGGVAAALTTTGGATKLASCGISDAKMHNVPAVYVVGLNSLSAAGLSPLQDTTSEGMGIVAQLRSELDEACLLIEDAGDIDDQLERARGFLAASRPVALAVAPEALTAQVPDDHPVTAASSPLAVPVTAPEALARELRSLVAGRRVVLFVGEEAARYAGAAELTQRLAAWLGAPTVWSQNGAAAASADSPYAYGCIAFGGNDRALELWRGLGSEDVVIALGLDPGEYVLGLEPVGAGTVVHLTGWEHAYGSRDGGFAHRCAGTYRRILCHLGDSLAAVLPLLELQPSAALAAPPAPRQLNDQRVPGLRDEGTVDLAALLLALHDSWRPGTLVFDDVCLAYKDRQFVTQRPSPHARVFSAHQSSTMGSAFGHAVGARIAAPDRDVFCFSGDGCFRLYGGALVDVAGLGINLFVIDNGGFGIIEQGYSLVVPDVPAERYHSALPRMDFVATARAAGWRAWRLAPDLSNLDAILADCRVSGGSSMLVSVPVDTGQRLGRNPRVEHFRSVIEHTPEGKQQHA